MNPNEYPEDKGNRESPGRDERARKLVEELRVKKHVFLPSGRTIWSVVGRERDEMVTINSGSTFCVCDDFYFRVLGGEVSECYHILAVRLAIDADKFSTTNFSDEEYESFLKALITDAFAGSKMRPRSFQRASELESEP